MLIIHLRVSDADSKALLPCRLRITTQQGDLFPPLGYAREFPCGEGEWVGGQIRMKNFSYTYIPGQCEIPLPAGVPLRFQIERGINYSSVDEEIILGAGQLTLRFELSELFPLQDFIVADARVHYVSPFTAALEGAAENLDLVQLLVCLDKMQSSEGHRYAQYSLLEAFSGQQPAFEKYQVCVVVNTLNTHPILGSVALLHTHRIVFPLHFGDVNDEWSVIDWCHQGHRKNGLVVWVDPFKMNPEKAYCSQALVAALLGYIDALEYRPTRTDVWLPWYYTLLNAGIRLPLIGASGKSSNRQRLGQMATFIPKDYPGFLSAADFPRHHAWIEGVRSGRGFVSSGPILHLSVNQVLPGGELHLESSAAVAVEFACHSKFAFHQCDLIYNGESVACFREIEQRDNLYYLKAALQLPLHESGWLALRCIGSPVGGFFTQPLFAHTSPIYVSLKNAKNVRQTSACAKLNPFLDHLERWYLTEAKIGDRKWLDQGMEQLEAARQRLTAAGD